MASSWPCRSPSPSSYRAAAGKTRPRCAIRLHQIRRQRIRYPQGLDFLILWDRLAVLDVDDRLQRFFVIREDVGGVAGVHVAVSLTRRILRVAVDGEMTTCRPRPSSRSARPSAAMRTRPVAGRSGGRVDGADVGVGPAARSPYRQAPAPAATRSELGHDLGCSPCLDRFPKALVAADAVIGAQGALKVDDLARLVAMIVARRAPAARPSAMDRLQCGSQRWPDRRAPGPLSRTDARSVGALDVLQHASGSQGC